jgi:hypothetical protein
MFFKYNKDKYENWQKKIPAAGLQVFINSIEIG